MQPTDPVALETLWVYLAASPLFGLTLTLVAYGIGLRLYYALNHNVILHPVVTSIALVIGFLWLFDTDYEHYFEGAQFVHFLLGPATVALAVPLYQHLDKLKSIWFPVSVAILFGVVIGALSSVGMAALLGANLEIQLSLAPKSVTVPIAMGISEQIGGIPSLTAVLVVATGIIGAVSGTFIFKLFRIHDESVKGIAMGLTAHGIGTARAFQVNKQMGAFSGLAMALSAFISALVLPVLLHWIGLI